MEERDRSLTRAALWMSGWLTLMVVMAVAGREATGELAVFQIMVLRSLIGLLLLYPLIHAGGGFGMLRTGRLGAHVARNTVHYAAQYGWFFAVTLIPLTQLVSIEFTMPLWVALLAAAFLGERLTAWKILAVIFGIAGVAIVVRPDASSVGTGQLIALAAAIGFALSAVMVKSLTATERPVAIVFWMLVVQSAIGLLPALPVWRWPSPVAWGWILVIAFAGTYSHYCMSRAMRHADATAVIPMDFLRVPLTTAVGWLLYAERIDRYTVLGAALILGGNLLNLRRPPVVTIPVRT
ncbi:MAG: DMT family transporter [Lautropia sp.]